LETIHVDKQSRRIAKNTLMLYFRMLFVMGVSLYTSRVILNTLGVEDFGINNVVGGIVALLGFLNSTLASGSQRFLTFHLGRNDINNLEKTFSVVLTMHIMLAVLILIIAETVGLWFLRYKLNIPAEKKSAAFWVYQFSILAGMISIIQVPYNASIIAHERMNVYAYVSIVEVILKLCIVYILRITPLDKLVFYAALIAAANLVIISIYRIYCKRQFRECRFRLVTDKAMYRPILTFSGWSVISLSVFSLSTQGINILLNIFFGPVVNAARAVSLQVNNAVTSFAANFQTAVNPNIVKLYAGNNFDSLHALIIQNMKFSFCLMWLFVLPVFLKIDQILAYWLVTIPGHTGLFCRLALIQSLVSCMLRPVSMTTLAIGKLKTVCIVVSFFYVLVLPLSYFLLKTGCPAYVPLVVFLIATAFDLLYQIFFIHVHIRISIRRLLKQVFVPLLFIVLCSSIPSVWVNYYFNDGFASLVLVSFISFFLIGASAYFLVLSKNMRQEIINRLVKRRIPNGI
jgi:O-antigen/teichoic acid export membrane protein